MRLPILPTLLTALAVATMIALGFWQLARAEEKEALLARYAAIEADAPPVAYSDSEEALFRRTSVECTEVIGTRGTAGTRIDGAKGWAQIARCRLRDGEEAEIALGWSRDPAPTNWTGGPVAGTIGPRGQLVADPPLAGLQPLAPPDPNDLPNNHRSYAGQWFLFAGVALVIFLIAMRGAQARKGRDG